MKYEKFNELLSELVELKKDEESLNEAFKKFSPDFNFLSFCRYENLVIETLKQAMKDDDDWINYWVYELECGTKAKKNSITDKNNHPIPIKTIKNLYDVIVKFNESDKES